MSEHIKREKADKDAWVCICGNTPADDGFYPINEDDREVEPTPEEWKTNQYFCDRCGRVIDQNTLEVVKKLDPDSIVRIA